MSTNAPESVEGTGSDQDESSRPQQPIISLLYDRNVQKALLLIVLAAAYSQISVATLSPVYGSIPSMLYHHQGTMACALLAFVARYRFGEYFERDISAYLPTVAFWIPTIQYMLFQQSSSYRSPYGSVITEALTYFPLVAMTTYSSAHIFKKVDYSAYSESVAEHGPALASYLLFMTVERLSKRVVSKFVGSTLLFSRVGMQLLVAGLYGLALPSHLLWPALPSLAFTVGANVHFPIERTTNLLNTTLDQYNYTILERKEAPTGYISVLENTGQHFRVMRCDHSLLGGEWTNIPRTESPSVAEPIYSIFAMLEAVRLVEPADGSAQVSDRNALTIGLGIGTTPSALIMHGIPTTIVEIDPVVYDFALKYFNLPRNHTPVIASAQKYVREASADGDTFDYIIHDVFTGGAEPVDLFTLEFMYGLHALLKDDGVIAINYAGDLSTGSAKIVVTTIRAIFPTCRIFRESPPAPRTSSHQPDFTNMVIFCKKTSGTPLTFRTPVEADYLHSGARRAHLYPRYEIPESAFAVEGGPKELDKLILKRGKTKQLEKLQVKSAIGHWNLMRTVMPAPVWEAW